MAGSSSPTTIQVRRLRFNLSNDMPIYWNENCPVKTHILNSIAILAPAFERLAISSVIPHKNKITDPELAHAVNEFIGQESAHGSEFIRYNQFLKQQGYDIKRLEKANLKRFKSLAKRLSPKMHLSLTLAAEHLTAIISDFILRDNWIQNAHPSFQALWRWHALEEIEHKAVVYDLYESIHGDYFSRIWGMFLISLMLGGLLCRNFFHLIYKDKLLFSLPFWKKCFRCLFAEPGFLRKLLVPYLHYFLPFFHPWQQKNRDILDTWRAFFDDNSERWMEILQNEQK